MLALLTLGVWAGGALFLSEPGQGDIATRRDAAGPAPSTATPQITGPAVTRTGPTTDPAATVDSMDGEEPTRAATSTPLPELPPELPAAMLPATVALPAVLEQPATETPLIAQIGPATALPVQAATPGRTGGPVQRPNNHPGPRWVTLQVGHLRNANLPEELRHLTPNTGAFAAGVSEVDVNVAVAQLTAQYLVERGYEVEILDATVPISYTTDLFIAIHADGNVRPAVRGFKAVAPWDGVPESDVFVRHFYEEYGKATGMPSDAFTSVAMAHYYAFNPTRYRHAISPGVPAALLEMGFVTNPEDRRILTTQQDRAAWGIANAVDRYFRSGAAGPTPSPYPTFTPTVTPTSTPTNTATSTATPTSTSTPTSTLVPTEIAAEASATAALITPVPPTATPPAPTATHTPLPTPTVLTGTITADGRWLPPLSPNGRRLPSPGSDAAPVLLDEAAQDLPMTADGRERVQIWQQFYLPDQGRSVWRKGPLRQPRH